VFLADGFARSTLDTLAARMHCSKSTLYALAPSKEELARRVAVHFFSGAAVRVEAAVASADDARARVDAYLRGVAAELRPASEAFFCDLARYPRVAAVYRRNTDIAAARVRDLISDGVATGEFRSVPSGFVADVVSATMVRIQQREIAATTGLDDAAAYAALADLVLHGLDADRPAPELFVRRPGPAG